jgi:hypothetical protein
MVVFYFHIMMNIKLCEHVMFGSSDTPRKVWGSVKGIIT